MDWEAAKAADLMLKIIASSGVILTAALGLAFRSLRRVVVTREEWQAATVTHEKEHDAINDRMADGELRFAKLDMMLSTLPTHQDVQRMTAQMIDLALKVERLSGELNRVEAVMRTVKRDADILIDGHLAVKS